MSHLVGFLLRILRRCTDKHTSSVYGLWIIDTGEVWNRDGAPTITGPKLWLILAHRYYLVNTVILPDFRIFESITVFCSLGIPVWLLLTMKAICVVTWVNETGKVTPIQSNLASESTPRLPSFSIHHTNVVIFSYRASSLTSLNFHSSRDQWTASVSWGCLRPRPLDPKPSDSLTQCISLFFVSQLTKIRQQNDRP